MTDSPCILAKNKPKKDGYVQVRVNGVKRYAHVVEWEKVNGPKPEGMELDHLCFVKNCINLIHLELVTHAENCRRRKKRTHCFAGHEFTRENTILKWGTNREYVYRNCRECRRAA